MALGEALLTDIRRLRRPSSEWFSIAEIEKQGHDLKIAARYIKRDTGQELVIARDEHEVHKRLDEWASRLLEQEVRRSEERLWEFCAENSVVPSAAEEVTLKNDLMQYIDASLKEVETAIDQYMHSRPLYSPRRFESVVARLKAELSTTLSLAAEIARLEVLESGSDSIDRIGHAQIRLERFLTKNYTRIPHPFNDNKSFTLSASELKRAIRLITYVVFKKVEEPRLRGFEEKFVSVFLRYLTIPRESSGLAADQVSALFEPFLKKLSFVFSIQDEKGKPIWYSALHQLVAGLHLTTSDLKRTDKAYWQVRSTQDAVLRLAYQLRHKGAHEAHEHPYFEHERHVYFVFAAIVFACGNTLERDSEIGKAVERQETADALRDLFVKIQDLAERRDEIRRSEMSVAALSRLDKLLGLAARAQAIWPDSSSTLLDLLEQEYGAVRGELLEADREAEIEAYNEAMREDYYSR